MYCKINDCIHVHIYTSRNNVYSFPVNFLFVVYSSQTTYLLCKLLISIFKGSKCENNHCPSIHPFPVDLRERTRVLELPGIASHEYTPDGSPVQNRVNTP